MIDEKTVAAEEPLVVRRVAATKGKPKTWKGPPHPGRALCTQEGREASLGR